MFISFPMYSFDNKHTSRNLVAVANQNKLLQYRENGENKGPTIEILNAILAGANFNADVEFMPWARAFAKGKNSPNTLILSMIRTPERENDFHWLIKVSQTARVFISLESKPQNYIDDIEQAKNKLIAVVLDSAGYKELIASGFSENKNIYVVSNNTQMINLLVNGRVDLVYADPNNVKSHLKVMNKSEVAIRFKKVAPQNQRNSYIALNLSTNSEIVNQLQQSAKQFEKTSEYARFLAQ
jgi:ABC-type amino acid transport substrate-binding protein